MGLFNKSSKNKEPKPNNSKEEPALYEESGGVTKSQAIEIIKGLTISPAQSTLGVAGGKDNYGVALFPSFVLIFFNGDKDHPMKIENHLFMPLQGIINNTYFYASQGDFNAAAECISEGLELNQNKDENYNLYCTAGEILWKLREMELARNMFLKAYQCKDCDQKAHALCQAAAVSCILRDPNTGFALYHKALQEEPESLETLHDLGGFHWDMGELDKAAQYYFSVLKKDPAYYNSYEELANLFAQLGNTSWSKTFMNCFTQNQPLPSDKLNAAESDMTVLLSDKSSS